MREVYTRTGDQPFERLEDFVTARELAEIAENYRRVAGSSLTDKRLRNPGPVAVPGS